MREYIRIGLVWVDDRLLNPFRWAVGIAAVLSLVAWLTPLSWAWAGVLGLGLWLGLAYVFFTLWYFVMRADEKKGP